MAPGAAFEVYLHNFRNSYNSCYHYSNYCPTAISGKKQKQRDRSLGCLQYRQMLTESEKSYALNPNGKKWVRESMAAEGLRKDFGCTDINKK